MKFEANKEFMGNLSLQLKPLFFPNFDKYRIYSSGINTGVLVVLRQVISSPMSNPVSLYHINDLLLYDKICAKSSLILSRRRKHV